MNILNITRLDTGESFVTVDALDEDFATWATVYTIAGVDPAGFNGDYPPVGCINTSVQVWVEEDPGPYVSGGTMTKKED